MTGRVAIAAEHQGETVVVTERDHRRYPLWDLGAVSSNPGRGAVPVRATRLTYESGEQALRSASFLTASVPCS